MCIDCVCDDAIMSSFIRTIAASFQYRGSPVRLYAGAEAMPGLVREARRGDASRLLVVTSPSCIRAGLVDRLRTETGLDLALFDNVQRESPLPSVEALRDIALQSGTDVLIGIGGGSAMVTTRAATILLRKAGRDARNLLIPTTPTTAMSRAGAAVLDPARHTRIEYFDPAARAAAVLLDAPALLSAPPLLFRNAAAAAFCSAVELLTVPSLHPLAFSDAHAAVRLLSGALSDFVEHPDDTDLRLLIGSCAFLAGRAGDSMPGVSPGIVHALAHQLQVLHGIDQGAAMSSLISAGLRYDLTGFADLDARLISALDAFGADSAPGQVHSLLQQAGLPVRLRDLGIERDHLASIAEASMTGFFATRAARPPSHPRELLSVLEDAW
jgi:alcohol dehydrogenase